MTTNIIIPAYNAARFLPQTLDSVRGQTDPDWNVLVVDDGSTDTTWTLAHGYAERDPRIFAIRQANAGPSAARNRGFAAAPPAAEFVTFLDADDLWEPDTLQTLSDALHAHPDALAAYGLAVAIDEHGELWEPGFLEEHQRMRFGIYRGRLRRWPLEWPTTFAVEAVTERIITAGTVLIRRTALDTLVQLAGSAGPFDPALRLWEDWDLWLRLTRTGAMHFVDQPVLRYRRHAQNLSGPSADLEDGARRVRAKLLDDLRRDSSNLRVARLGARAHFRLRAAGHVARARGCLRERQPRAALQQLKDAAYNLREARRSE